MHNDTFGIFLLVLYPGLMMFFLCVGEFVAWCIGRFLERRREHRKGSLSTCQSTQSADYARQHPFT